MRNWIRRLIHGLFPTYVPCEQCNYFDDIEGEPGRGYYTASSSPFCGRKRYGCDGCR